MSRWSQWARERWRWALPAALAICLAAAAAGQTTASPATTGQPTQAKTPPATGSAPQATQAPPMARFVTGATVVDVPVLVLDSQGQPIGNLGLDDFNLHDDYKPQKLVGFDNQPRPISLGIVVDTSDRAAVLQARRAAQVVADMVVGAAGEAAIFIPNGPEPKEVIGFTNDNDAIVSALRHLKLTPSGSDVTEAIQMAALALRKRPSDRTRSILVITRQSPKQGTFSQALIEGQMNDGMPVFRIYPNAPKEEAPPNPLSPYTNGTGVGSSRDQMPVQPVGSHGPQPESPGCCNLLNLGAIASSVGTMLKSNSWDYVYVSGGLDLHASSDADFDTKLSQVGNVLRSAYHLYYRPDDLTAGPAIHVINLRVAKNTGVDRTSYRHTYVGMSQR